MRTIRRQAKATSLDHAIELAKRHAKERRLPSKVMADLMGVELKTYYRWLLDNTLPLNRVNQFSSLTTQSTHECPTSARSQPHGKARQNTRQERV